MTIAKNLQTIKKTLPENVTLVAVSKTHSIEEILETYSAGQRVFGENKVQELTQKQELLPKDIEWHMIGHLQRNKVKYLAPFVSLIHGVDSLRLLVEINKQAQKNNRIIKVLLQKYIAEEESKFGMDAEEIEEILSNHAQELSNVEIVGLMGMASFTDQYEIVREEFRTLKKTFDRLSKNYPKLTILSMGMSGDYPIAIEEGSTMVRIGSAIFGQRNYG
ncbi:Predicted enzyme with a TIM-barrel fold [Weeksella virosa]|uniref:YggS family pyridoxal phosphate-dependent enzyme n=1 Tax=Weeksella virosa TaxID=1014 RepID=UPI000DFE3EBC|nr:YggS family pyridoxal phosphate-dependent enzyme [Weeksella virosa]SUP53404.1 Predicted enzyme with a TIM-barrel fold [Weeksella virosa]